MSSWFVDDNTKKEMLTEEIRENNLLQLRNAYYNLLQQSQNTPEEKLAVVQKLNAINSSEQLQIDIPQETLFENLPFECQLRFMCFVKSAEILSSMGSNSQAVEYYLHASELFEGDLSMWKGFYRVVSSCHMIFLQKMCLQHIAESSLHQLPSSLDNLDYIVLYLQLCWKLQDMESIKSCTSVLESLNIPSSYTDLHLIVDYVNYFNKPPSPFVSSLPPQLPSAFSPEVISSLFPVSPLPSKPLISSYVEVIHVNDMTCWSSVLDKLNECLLSSNHYLYLEFVFPDNLSDDLNYSKVTFGTLTSHSTLVSEVPLVIPQKSESQQAPIQSAPSVNNSSDVGELGLANIKAFFQYHLRYLYKIDSPPESSFSQFIISPKPSRPRTHSKLPTYVMPQMNLAQADRIRTSNCMHYLHSLLHGRYRMEFLEFVSLLCDELCKFPVLILFESHVRVSLLYFLQRLAKAYPQMVSSRGELILLMHELLYWFSLNVSRLRSHPDYANVDQYYTIPFYMDLSNSSPLSQLRCAYLRYQELSHRPTSSAPSHAINSYLHQVIDCLHNVLDKVDEDAEVNTMITSRAQAILIGNSALCLNQGILGVIIPFYGSSSFINPANLLNTEQESSVQIYPLIEALSSKSSMLPELLDSLGLEIEFADYLCDHPSFITMITDSFTSDEALLSYYTKLVSKLLLEDPSRYAPLLLSLHKNLLQRSNPPIQFLLQMEIALLQLQQSDSFGQLLSAVSRYDYIKSIHALYPFFASQSNKMTVDCLHSVASTLTSLIYQWKDERSDSTFASFLKVDELASKFCADVVRWLIDDVARSVNEMLSFPFLFDSLYITLVLSEIVAEVNPEVATSCYDEVSDDMQCLKCPAVVLRHITYSFIRTHTLFSTFGHNTCCSYHGAFLLYELQLLMWWSDITQPLCINEINQVLRCALNLTIAGTRQDNAWDICQPSLLAYKDIVALSRITRMLNPTASGALYKKIMELMLDWLDLDSRKTMTKNVTKDALILGVYDSKLMDAVQDIMRLRTEVMDLEQLVSLLKKYEHIRDPLLSTLYKYKIEYFVNKSHRDDVVFNLTVQQELNKEGVWTVLAILYDPTNIDLWVSFIQWLFQVTYYEEDNIVNNELSCSPSSKFHDGSFFEIDEVLDYIRVNEFSNYQVYVNIVTIVDYIINLDMKNGYISFLEKIPDQYKPNIASIDPAAVSVLAKYMYRSAIVSATFGVCTCPSADRSIKLRLLNNMFVILKTFLRELRPLSLRWNDYLVMGVGAIMQSLLENTTFDIQTIDSIVNYLYVAEEESNALCCVKGKSLSRLIIHLFLVYVFVSSNDGKAHLGQFLERKGLSIFHSLPNPYVFNSNLVNSKLQFVMCKACNQVATLSGNNQILTCYLCGLHVHIQCAVRTGCMMNVRSSSGTNACICAECVAQNIDAIQLMLLKNALAAMNHIISVDPAAHLPHLFQRKILQLAGNLKPENKEVYAKLDMDILMTFFKKTGNIIPIELHPSIGDLSCVYGRKRDYMITRALILKDGMEQFISSRMLLYLNSIMESLSKTSTTFAQSINNNIIDYLPDIMDSFASSHSGITGMTKTVGLVLAFIKGRARSNEEVNDIRFLKIYQKLIDYVNALCVAAQLQTVMPPPMPVTPSNINAYIRFVNRTFGKKKLSVC